MSTARGFVQGYNAQAVANDEQVVVCAEVTDEHNDLGQLHPMIKATAASLAGAGIDQRPETLLADAGYASEENFAATSISSLVLFASIIESGYTRIKYICIYKYYNQKIMTGGSHVSRQRVCI